MDIHNIKKISKLLTGEKFNLVITVQANEYIYHKIGESMREALIKLLPESSCISRCVILRNKPDQKYTLVVKGAGIPDWGDTRKIMIDILKYMWIIEGKFLSLSMILTWYMRSPKESAYIKEDYSLVEN